MEKTRKNSKMSLSTEGKFAGIGGGGGGGGLDATKCNNLKT